MSTQHSALKARIESIDVLVLDVDGVLTDGRITYTADGTEIKAFHVRDGSGIKAWQLAGKHVVIISGRASRAVEVRAAELGIRTVLQGIEDKRTRFRQLLTEHGWKREQVCCVGDDLADLPLFAACGFAVAVADACADTQSAAHWVTRAAGGRGAVREVIELILRGQGHWQRIVERFRPASI
jgi:3-deoxy-D-manno-octulosonate 8-phosphate phosphatase (KDO 8-P phosphatase)